MLLSHRETPMRTLLPRRPPTPCPGGIWRARAKSRLPPPLRAILLLHRMHPLRFAPSLRPGQVRLLVLLKSRRFPFSLNRTRAFSAGGGPPPQGEDLCRQDLTADRSRTIATPGHALVSRQVTEGPGLLAGGQLGGSNPHPGKGKSIEHRVLPFQGESGSSHKLRFHVPPGSRGRKTSLFSLAPVKIMIRPLIASCRD